MQNALQNGHNLKKGHILLPLAVKCYQLPQFQTSFNTTGVFSFFFYPYQSCSINSDYLRDHTPLVSTPPDII